MNSFTTKFSDSLAYVFWTSHNFQGPSILDCQMSDVNKNAFSCTSPDRLSTLMYIGMLQAMGNTRQFEPNVQRNFIFVFKIFVTSCKRDCKTKNRKRTTVRLGILYKCIPSTTKKVFHKVEKEDYE